MDDSSIGLSPVNFSRGEDASGSAEREFCAAEARPETPAFDAQVQAIVRGFLIPACQYRPAEGEKYDAHAQWKPVNVAAGVIAGWVSSFDPELLDRVGIAASLSLACREQLLATDLAEEYWPARLKIASPKGLPPRLAEALLRLGVER